MTEVVFVRHGATGWSGRRYCGRSDPPLSDQGREAVLALASSLAPTLARDVSIVTSPLRRARRTAEAIAAAAGLDDVQVDVRWREADFGVAEGCTFDELAELAPELARALADGVTDIDWPGGDTAADFRARMAAAWADLAVAALVRPLVVVSHAGPIRHAIAIAGSLPPAAVGLPEPATAVRIAIPPHRRHPGSVRSSLA